VPLKIIHPLLEAASLEDTPDLQDIWASMMANAADPRDSSPVTASFPVILKELSSRHVKFLAALFADIGIKAAKHDKTPHDFRADYKLSELQDVYCRAGLSRVDCLHTVSLERPPSGRAPQWEWRLTDDAKSKPDELATDLRNFDYMMAVLRRHNVIGETAWPRVVDRYDAIKNPEPKLVEIEMETEYFLTEIGVCFVAACETPKAVTKPSASPEKSASA
jgi:Abortive infection alpha